MMRNRKISGARVKKTILLHSADKDMMKSLSILLQEQYTIISTQTVEELELQRTNNSIYLLVVDLERSIPALLSEFESRRKQGSNAPIIVLYAFRQGRPDWEKRIRLLADRVLYKPVPIEQILEAIAVESELHTEKQER